VVSKLGWFCSARGSVPHVYDNVSYGRTSASRIGIVLYMFDAASPYELGCRRCIMREAMYVLDQRFLRHSTYVSA
jgi:hypothetical protein